MRYGALVIHEIQQVIWLDTPKGQALAKFIVDRGVDSDLEWITVLQETGQVLSFDNSEVLVCKSFTLGRRTDWSEFHYGEAPKKPKSPRKGSPDSMRRQLRRL